MGSTVDSALSGCGRWKRAGKEVRERGCRWAFLRASVSLFKNLKNGHAGTICHERGMPHRQQQKLENRRFQKSPVPWQREGSGVKGCANRKGPRRRGRRGHGRRVRRS